MNLSPWHGGVLSAAALVSAPATWAALVEGTLPVADALSRFLLCVVVCWVAINAAMPLLVPSPSPARGERSGADQALPHASAPSEGG